LKDRDFAQQKNYTDGNGGLYWGKCIRWKTTDFVFGKLLKDIEHETEVVDSECLER
jgi:hypothetical protein